jgi:hypothetical protein
LPCASVLMSLFVAFVEFQAFCSFVSGFGRTGFEEVRVRALR